MWVILLMPEQKDVYYLFYKIMSYFFHKIDVLYHDLTNDRSLAFDNDRSLSKLGVRQNKCKNHVYALNQSFY